MAQRHRTPSARREEPALSGSEGTCFFHTFAAVHYTLELTWIRKTSCSCHWTAWSPTSRG